MVDPIVADAPLVLLPGQSAVVPVEWGAAPGTTVTKCSTHPDAPAGLTVYSGTFDHSQYTNVYAVNESPVAITLTDQEPIAVGEFEDAIPDLDEFVKIIDQHDAYRLAVKWSGEGGSDRVIETTSPRPDRT